MAIFHLDVQTISRSAGRSAVAAAAYRAGSRLRDERTGQVFDYARRSGIGSTFIAAPVDAPDWANDRDRLWNAAEAAETRKNSTVAREWLVALPAELDDEAREQLVRDLAAELVLRFGVAVDAAIHAPSKEGDERNHHAHLLTSTRSVGPDGFGAKTRVLDAAKTGGEEIKAMRAIWADLCNDALEAAGRSERIDPRAKGIQAAEAAERAQEAESEAEALEIISGDANSLSDVRRGLKAVIDHPSALFARNGAEKAAERRLEAQEHRKRAERLSHPAERHKGPQRAAMERKAAQREAEEKKRAEKEFWLRHREKMRELDRIAEEHAERERILREQKQQREQRRAKKAQDFVIDWIIQTDTFPTPSQKWEVGAFRFSPEFMRKAAKEQVGIELKPEEVRDGMASALREWVSRIVKALPDLKPARSIWEAFTGGHAEAGKALHDALKEEPDIARPLQPAIEKFERLERAPTSRKSSDAVKAEKPKPPSPSNNGPSM
jgi:hypothetical protein